MKSINYLVGYQRELQKLTSLAQHNFPVSEQSRFLKLLVFSELLKRLQVFSQNVLVPFILNDAIITFKREISYNILGKLK